jgi:hypothetical protein
MFRHRSQPTEDRVRYIDHKGTAVLLVDMSQCSAAEVEKISKAVPGYVTGEPRGSVLILADLTGAEFDKNAVAEMKKGMVFDRPHVKRSAWVGADALPKAFYDSIKAFTQRDFPAFPTREAALDWLVQ